MMELERGKHEIRDAMRRAVISGNAEEVWVLVRRNIGYRIVSGEIGVTLKAPTIDDIAAQQAKAA